MTVMTPTFYNLLKIKCLYFESVSRSSVAALGGRTSDVPLQAENEPFPGDFLFKNWGLFRFFLYFCSKLMNKSGMKMMMTIPRWKERLLAQRLRNAFIIRHLHVIGGGDFLSSRPSRKPLSSRYFIAPQHFFSACGCIFCASKYTLYLGLLWVGASLLIAF